MGLFGSTKTKVLVGTTVVRVMDDKLYMSPMRKAIFTDIGRPVDIVDQYLENILTGMGPKALRYYRKGATDYLYGRPQGSVISPASAAAEVQAAIEAEVSATVTLAYSRFGFLNYPHLAMQLLDDTYGFNIATAELESLSTSKGYTVTLQKVTVTVPAAEFDAIPPEGLLPPTGDLFDVFFNRSVSATDVAVDIEYSWVVPEWDYDRLVYLDVGHTETANVTSSMPVLDYSPEQDFFHAAYVLGGNTHFWLYRMGDGTHTELDEYFDVGFTENGSYFPWVYFRYNATAGDTDTESDHYKQSVKMCRSLGIDYQEMVDKIHEQAGMGDVQQAVLWFAVKPVSTNKAELEYLHAYWEEAYASQGGQLTALSRADFNAAFTDATANPYNNVIRDSRLQMTLMHNGIWKRTVTGNIGPVGFLKTEQNTFTTLVDYYDGDGSAATQTVTWTGHYYMKQVTETTYEEIQVVDLTLVYKVYGGKYSTGDLDTNNDILYIPLDMAIAENLSAQVREELYCRSMHFVFNSMVMVKVKWYQQGVFKVVLAVVAIVLAIAGFAEVGVKIFGAIMASEGILAAVLIVLEYAFYFYLTDLAFKYIVKELGVENSFILAVLAIVQAIRTGDFSNVTAFLKSIQLYLKITLGLVKAITQELTDMAGNIRKELYSTYTTYQKEMDELNKIWQELQASPIMEYIVIPGESVAMFKARTGNPVEVLHMLTGKARDFVEQMRYVPVAINEEYAV